MSETLQTPEVEVIAEGNEMQVVFNVVYSPTAQNFEEERNNALRSLMDAIRSFAKHGFLVHEVPHA